MAEFGPTHCVPALGMHAWVEPDPAASPVATLAPGTQLQLLEVRGAWAQVCASNGWRGWVDSRQLVWGTEPPPAAGAVVGYQPVAGRSTNGFAVASLVLGILWVWWIGSVLALVFGYVARSQIARTSGVQGGRGLALAGIILGWIGVALLIVVIVMAAATTDVDGASALVRHLTAAGEGPSQRHLVGVLQVAAHR